MNAFALGPWRTAFIVSFLLPWGVHAQEPAAATAPPAGTAASAPPAKPADDDSLSFLNDNGDTKAAPSAAQPGAAAAPAAPAGQAEVAKPQAAPDSAPLDIPGVDSAPPAGQPAGGDALPVNQAETPAADKRPAHGLGIEEIVVTAQKREESINSVPIAINAYSGDTLKELGVKDTQSLSRLIPGFSANENGGQSTIFTLRGVGFNDTTYTATGTVGVYMDEVGLPYSSMTRGPSVDIQRVEVLKGPQGTLYGRNTTGGLINYIPNRPTDQFEMGTNTSYGRFDTLDTENFISGPILSSLKGRVAVRYVDMGEGWQHSQTRPGDTFGAQSKVSGRATLEWTPLDKLLVKATLEGWQVRGQPQAAQALTTQAQNPFVGSIGLAGSVANYPYDPTTKNPQQADWAPGYDWRIDDKFLMESLKATWNISDTMTFTGIASHLRVAADGSDAATSGINVRNIDSRLDARVETNAFEARLSDQWWGDLFKWTLGVNASRDMGYENRNLDISTLSDFFPGPIPFTLLGLPANPLATSVILNGQPTINQRAVFLNTDTKPFDSFDITFGLRYTQNFQHFFSCGYEPPGNPPPDLFSELFTALSVLDAAEYTLETGQPGKPSIIQPGECFALHPDGSNAPFTDTLDEKNLSGRVALSKTFDDGTLLYASVSRGYKAGGFPVLNTSSTTQLEPAHQEELLDYEGGTKISFFDSRLHIDFGGFYYNYKNKQLLTREEDPLFGPLGILKNAPRSHNYGSELSLQTTPFEGLFLAVAASYVKTDIDDFISTNFTGKTENFNGKPFNFAPEVQVSAVADYTVPVSDSLDAGVGVDFNYTSSTNGTIEQNPNYAMAGYRIYGARLHLGPSDKKWSAYLFGRNLGNELINTGAFNFGDTVTRYVGMPRTYGIGFSYHYE